MDDNVQLAFISHSKLKGQHRLCQQQSCFILLTAKKSKSLGENYVENLSAAHSKLLSLDC